MPKKILIHSLIFSPDGVSTAYLYNDIALKFQENGYEVLVLTTTPHYNVVESQLAVQPLKWKVWGICKESCFSWNQSSSCTPEEIQKYISACPGICLLAYYLFPDWFVPEKYRCHTVTFPSFDYRCNKHLAGENQGM